MQTGDIVFSAIIPILETSKLVIELKKNKNQKNNKNKTPNHKWLLFSQWNEQDVSGVKKKYFIPGFWQLCWRDFILGKQSLLWWHKQALSSQSKLGIFPACTCLYVAGISKWSELTHLHNQTLLLLPATPGTFPLPLHLGSPFPKLLQTVRLLTWKKCWEPVWHCKSPKGIAQIREACWHCLTKLLLLWVS